MGRLWVALPAALLSVKVEQVKVISQEEQYSNSGRCFYVAARVGSSRRAFTYYCRTGDIEEIVNEQLDRE